MTMQNTALAAHPDDRLGPYDSYVRPDGRIHRKVFVDEKIFDEEMDKIFAGSWVFLAHEGEISQPHDFKTTTLGRRPVIVSKAADGRVYALLNRCSHRGALVCVDQRGNSKRFQCPYHHWTFGNDGRLITVPLSKGQGPNFDMKANGLGRVPRVENYRGYIFGSLNPAVEPLLDWLGAARPILDWAIDSDKADETGMTVVKGTQHVIGANWKMQLENVTDGYHAAFLHQSMVEMTDTRHGGGRGLGHWRSEAAKMSDTYLGNGHKLLDQRGAIESPWAAARPVPGREAFSEALVARLGREASLEYLNLASRAYINLTIYPNLFIMGHGQYAVYEPVAVNKTKINFYTILPNNFPEEARRLRIRFVEDFNSFGLPDDTEALERVQDALSRTPEMEWLNYERGLATETHLPDGSVRGAVTDETSQRWAYKQWAKLMNRDVKLTAVQN